MANDLNKRNITEELHKLACTSLNIRGLKNKRKRLAFFNNIRKENHDIIALQETYLTESNIKEIRSEWGGALHFSSAVGRSKGLLTLFKRHINPDSITLLHSCDRILISTLRNFDEVIYIVNIYGPCNEGEKPSFLKYFEKIMEETIHLEVNVDNVICMGDFNMVLNNQLDVIAGAPHSHKTVDLFNTCIDGLSLTDTWRQFHPNEKNHTWRRCSPSVARRLDYIFTGEGLAPYISDCFIKSLGLSDHRAVTCLLKFSTFERKPSRYKINVSLIQDKNYVSMMNKAIAESIKNNSHLDPHLKWEMVKIDISEKSQQYSRLAHLNRKSKLDDLISELNVLEEAYNYNTDNKELEEKIRSTKAELELFQHYKTKGAQIRAGIKWIEEGERNTKFFLGLEKTRSKANLINSVIDADGKEVRNEIDILKCIHRHFKKLYNKLQGNEALSDQYKAFTRSLDIPRLNDEDKEECEYEITESEVALALKSMHNGAVPGLDGIPCEIYKVFWKTIKDPLMESYQYSFDKGILSPSQRLGILTLIPKGIGLDRRNLKNWRPIAITNVDYKLIAKVMALRLKKIITSIVGDSQFGFIPGRNIANLIRQVDDISDYLKAKKQAGYMLCIDFEKAFDTISPTYIIKAFESFGFGEKYLKWIEVLLAERNSCIQNGGYLSENFMMERGVRQGCPVSPLLFAIAVEILARKISQDGKIKGIDLPYNYTIKILQYADDTTLFARNIIDIREILSRLKEFASISGLNLNISKSVCMPFGFNHRYSEAIEGIQQVDKVKLLGVFFSSKVSACNMEENWIDKIDKIEKIIRNWSRRNISIMGKIHILKVFGISTLVHIMQSITLPPKIISSINRIFFKFIWKKKYNNRKAFEKVKRRTMCASYSTGGLNMIDIQKMQDSFILNKTRDLLIGDMERWKAVPLCILKSVGGRGAYLSSSKPVNFKGMERIKSPFWKQSLQLWLKNAYNDNINIPILKQPLFNNVNITYNKQTIFLPSCIERNIMFVQDVWWENRLLSLQEYQELFGDYPRAYLDYTLIYNALKNLIINENIDNESNDDHTPLFQQAEIESLNRKKIYELTNVQEEPFIHNLWLRRYKVDLADGYWNIAIDCTKETRLRVLHWKILHNIWPTNILLKKMNIKNSENCSWCGVTDYTEHFFFTCKVVKTFWKHIKAQINIELGVKIDLEEKTVMTGLLQKEGITTGQIRVVNHAILIGKLTISKYKYGKSKLLNYTFDNEARSRKLWPKYR